ncbi:MAG: glycosyltransferase [Candidatus Actinomarina sp.]|tara:strand:- start:4329 stop:5495 length:1167 start_codon:yes stop_codon:yes gene_type:complete
MINLLYFTNILSKEVKIQQEICYLTYQSFPAETANSLQTISNIKYLVRNGANVELIFPLREKSSSDSVEEIKKHYLTREDFKVTGVKHFLPFGRINILEGFFFHISHFLWSYYVVTFKIKKTDNRKFLTRSDWILYFLARRGCKVVFECHQTSKVRTYIINRSKSFPNAKFIFLNKHLQDYYKMNGSNSQILHNGVDSEILNNLVPKSNNNREGLVFVGNLRRFNESRGIEFIVHAFKNSKFLQNHKLSIIGGPDTEAQKLKVKIKELNLQERIFVTGRVGRSEIGEIYANANIGILINSSSNQHSYKYTSPLKYFEYIYMGLKVIGVDFPSHRALPRNSEINFFQENNIHSFENAVKQALEKNRTVDNNRDDLSLNTRAKKIISLLN